MIEKIETDRCVLRKVSLDDAHAIFDTYAQDDDVVKYLDWPKHQSLQETVDFLTLCQERWDNGKEYSFAIIDQKTNNFM